MNLKNLAALAAFLLVTGCSSLRCGAPGPYMDATALPPLQVPAGLAALDSRDDVRVPNAADVVHPELRGQRYEASDGSMQCLDAPPPIERKTAS